MAGYGAAMSDSRTHRYDVETAWQDPAGAGTADYRSYPRAFALRVPDKPVLAGSADPAFLGDPQRHNPEDLFVGALSACHMLTYLALAARERVVVLEYRDAASGILEVEPRGGGAFREVVLRPHVVVRDASSQARALELHAEAARRCFIHRSVATPVRCVAQVDLQGGER